MAVDRCRYNCICRFRRLYPVNLEFTRIQVYFLIAPVGGGAGDVTAEAEGCGEVIRPRPAERLPQSCYSAPQKASKHSLANSAMYG